MSIIWKTVLGLSLSTFLFSTNSIAENNDFNFSPAEHITLGDAVKISFPDKDKKHNLLHLHSGLNLSYGTVLSLGDFYGVIGKPISQGETPEERHARFIAAFNSFALSASVVKEAETIIGIINNEKTYIENGLKNGEAEEDMYAKIGLEYDRQFNCATGGGCTAAWWSKSGRYLNLAKENFDHFGDNAMIAYKAGHQAAMEEALIAGQTRDVNRLEIAYAMNAFACHFLSDRFSTGHMRTPRKELYDHISPSIIGSLLSNFMHNEESVYGLHVHNNLGAKWTAYGDKSYFSDKNAEHRKKQLLALQFSANQVFLAYKRGQIGNNNEIDNLIPVADEKGNAAINDTASLFYWDEASQKLMRRQDLKNPQDKRWTDNWWGWSTLVELGGGDMIPG